LRLAIRTGVRLHLLHTHSEGVIELVRRAKFQGMKVTSEVDPVFLLTANDLDRLGPLAVPGGIFAKRRTDLIWRAIRKGTIDVIATDHAPHTAEEIVSLSEEDPFLAPFGTPQLEHYFSALLTRVNERKITIGELVREVSENPAKVAGIYP
jgi:dihydroorotase-like cyclic amidohydrolase